MATAPMQAPTRRTGRGAHVLVVDDDPHVCESLGEILDYAGHTSASVGDGKTALDVLDREAPDLLLLDLELPRVSGMEVLRAVRQDHPSVAVVIVSGKGTIQSAVEATKLGAYDFLEKPVDAQRALVTVRNALEKTRLQRERDRLLEEARARYEMVGSSAAMQRVYRLIDKAAGVDSKVLLLGASGSGKELVACAIHHHSSRAAGPFVAVNCAAVPEALIESELFGHEKGAFTGAHAQHPGKFEQADGGTLFLDEIGDMSLMTQARVLRVLEEGQVTRVGGRHTTSVDVRVIAATNRDLGMEIEEGNFREDLFYRLNVVTIDVPSLTERREDVPVLVNHFIDHFAAEIKAEAKPVSARAMHLLVEYDWPGNVRQLRNVVERLVVLSDGATISVGDVREALRAGMKDTSPLIEDLREARDSFERTFTLKSLVAHDWQIQETAEALGIDRSHLWKKMRRHGIDVPKKPN